MTEKIEVILEENIVSRIDELRCSRTRVDFLREIILSSVQNTRKRISGNSSLEDYFPELKRRNSDE